MNQDLRAMLKEVTKIQERHPTLHEGDLASLAGALENAHAATDHLIGKVHIKCGGSSKPPCDGPPIIGLPQHYVRRGVPLCDRCAGVSG